MVSVLACPLSSLTHRTYTGSSILVMGVRSYKRSGIWRILLFHPLDRGRVLREVQALPTFGRQASCMKALGADSCRFLRGRVFVWGLLVQVPPMFGR